MWVGFGRTPVVNSSGGRDHWPRVSPCLLAGGGLRSGQVIGSTDRTGAEPRSRPVTYKDIFRTLYRHLGLDAKQETITEPKADRSTCSMKAKSRWNWREGCLTSDFRAVPST